MVATPTPIRRPSTAPSSPRPRLTPLRPRTRMRRDLQMFLKGHTRSVLVLVASLRRASRGMCWMRWRSDSCSLIMLDIDAVGEVILPGNGKLPPSRTSLSMLDLLKPYRGKRHSCKCRGVKPCPSCNPGQAYGFYNANQMTRCFACHGRGLLAHQDGYDTVCGMCNGKGMLPCIACGSRGYVTCNTCTGYGFLLAKSMARVRWKTLSARKDCATRGAASVPEEVFHRAKGVQLCNIQAYQCTPAFFADSYPLNQFSSEVIASRLPVPPSARIISERHIISVVPVTRVTMAHLKQSFSFYVVGYNRDVFIRDYPSKFCWGLCCCFEWMGK